MAVNSNLLLDLENLSSEMKNEISRITTELSIIEEKKLETVLSTIPESLDKLDCEELLDIEKIIALVDCTYLSTESKQRLNKLIKLVKSMIKKINDEKVQNKVSLLLEKKKLSEALAVVYENYSSFNLSFRQNLEHQYSDFLLSSFEKKYNDIGGIQATVEDLMELIGNIKNLLELENLNQSLTYSNLYDFVKILLKVVKIKEIRESNEHYEPSSLVSLQICLQLDSINAQIRFDHHKNKEYLLVDKIKFRKDNEYLLIDKIKIYELPNIYCTGWKVDDPIRGTYLENYESVLDFCKEEK